MKITICGSTLRKEEIVGIGLIKKVLNPHLVTNVFHLEFMLHFRNHTTVFKSETYDFGIENSEAGIKARERADQFKMDHIAATKELEEYFESTLSFNEVPSNNV